MHLKNHQHEEQNRAFRFETMMSRANFRSIDCFVFSCTIWIKSNWMIIYSEVIMHSPIIGLTWILLPSLRLNIFSFSSYGGLTFGDQIEDDYFNRSHASVWFNNKGIHPLFIPWKFHSIRLGYHALPSYLNVMNNLILRSKIADPETAGKFGISTYSHPFTLNSDLLSQQSLEQRISDFGIAITVLCAYAFVPAAVILYLVREYVTQEKRLMFICGVKPLSKNQFSRRKERENVLLTF